MKGRRRSTERGKSSWLVELFCDEQGLIEFSSVERLPWERGEGRSPRVLLGILARELLWLGRGWGQVAREEGWIEFVFHVLRTSSEKLKLGL
jgi:hypothetical protein